MPGEWTYELRQKVNYRERHRAITQKKTQPLCSFRPTSAWKPLAFDISFTVGSDLQMWCESVCVCVMSSFEFNSTLSYWYI